MIKKIVASAMLVACVFNGFAQTPDEFSNGSKYIQYAGVQVNDLMKQIINLNSNTSPIDNPYLLVYSIEAVKCKWALNLGFGYNYQDVQNKLSPSGQESKINDLSYRIGIGRRYMIGNRWEAGFSLDFVGQYNLDKTFTASSTVFGTEIDSTVSTSTTKTVGYGAGLQLNFAFHISQRILIGTEATFYYMDNNQKQNSLNSESITDTQNSSLNTSSLSNSNTETDMKTFTTSLPVALFLIVKF